MIIAFVVALIIQASRFSGIKRRKKERTDVILNATAFNEEKELTGNRKWNGVIFIVEKQEYFHCDDD